MNKNRTSQQFIGLILAFLLCLTIPVLAAAPGQLNANATLSNLQQYSAAQLEKTAPIIEVGQQQQQAEIAQVLIDQIVLIPNGLRPEPSAYLSQDYIASHLAQFKDGVTRISALAPTGSLGRLDGTFVMPKAIADKLIAKADGDIAKFEQLLGLAPGYLGINPVRIDIPSPSGLRMPSGNEVSANYQWLPGGYTSGGIPEAIIDQVKPNMYTVSTISIER